MQKDKFAGNTITKMKEKVETNYLLYLNKKKTSYFLYLPLTSDFPTLYQPPKINQNNTKYPLDGMKNYNDQFNNYFTITLPLKFIVNITNTLLKVLSTKFRYLLSIWSKKCTSIYHMITEFELMQQKLHCEN